MFGEFCAAAGNDGDVNGVGDGGGQRDVETLLSAVAVDRGEKDFAGACGDALSGPLYGVEICRVVAAADFYIPVIFCFVTLGVDREDYCLGAEFVGEFGAKFRALDGGGVDGDFVGACANDGAGVVESANAATGGERYGEFGGDAADCVEECGPAIARSGDVEDNEFVGAFGVVARGEGHGITGVAKADEVDAFDDASAVGVETGNDAAGQAHGAASVSAMATKLARSCAPGRPLFSGWNWTAWMFLCSMTATNSEPWVQVATADGFFSAAHAP